jgi:hypothetical protein
MSSTDERENSVPKHHNVFKIFCIYKYRSFAEYLSKRLAKV